MFGGMPAYLISTIYKGNLIKEADNFLKKLSVPIASIFMTMAGFYILLLLIGVDPYTAGFGSIAYGLSSYFFIILAAGHNSKAMAIAYMAPMVGGIIYSYRKDAIKGAIITAIFLSLEIASNHLQITYYALLMLLFLGLAELYVAIAEKRIPRFLYSTGMLLAALLLSIAVNFGSLYTTYEYGKYSMRGKSDLTPIEGISTSGLEKDYATSWSYGIGETFSFIIPNIKGGASKAFPADSRTVDALKKNNATQYVNQLPAYWGKQPGTSGPVYLGAIVCFLFVLALFVVKGPEKWWLVSATILSVLLAWGKNFMPLTDLFMDYVPGYNKFRAVSMTLVIAGFTIPLLAITGLRDIMRGIPADTLKKYLIRAFAVTGGVLLLFLIFPGINGSFLSANEVQYPDWLSNALIADRKGMFRNDILRSLFFIVSSAALLYAFAGKKIKQTHLVMALSLLVIIDMVPVDKRYLNSDNFTGKKSLAKGSEPTVADKEILKDKAQYRVLNLTVSPFDDATTSRFHQSIGGYHGAKMRRYQELIGNSILPEITLFTTSAQNASSMEDLIGPLQTTNAINMLNTKYIIINPDAAPVRNPYAMGNAWFVSKVNVVNNADEEIASLPTLDIANEAVTEESFALDLPITNFLKETTDIITLISYRANELKYDSETSSAAFAVFSEIYYPKGWKAYIDGKESEIYRVNYTLRGLFVPAGRHEIVFEFRPASYYAGQKVSLAGSIILIIAALSVFFVSSRANLTKE